MSYELIICEKPSAAQKIAAALADGKPVKKAINKVAYFEIAHKKQDIVVAAAAGHLYGVGQKGERTFTYPVEEMEWQPTSDLSKDAAFSKKYLTALKKLAKDATNFTVATDYDIEGETIGYNIIRFICKQKDANRMKFSTLTKDDLIAAYAEKQPHIDWGQANAGETRHFLDWLYGINLSRALTQSVKAAGSFKILSIGRVQGPALKMVMEREKEIAAFKPEDYWQIELTTAKEQKEILANHKADKFWKEAEAKKVYEKCSSEKKTTVADISTRQTKQAAPTPFDLGALQTEAYRCFKIKPKMTLQIAQALYSAGFISYPRTSSQKLPAKLGFKKILAKLAKQEQYTTLANEIANLKSLKPNEGKKSDPAHPAIYPTGLQPAGVDERDLRVYDLVVKRFLATFAEPATRETMKITFEIKEEPFIAKGTRTVKPGWHTYYQPYVKLDETELPKLEKGEQTAVKKLDLQKKQTQPPKRYTQSSIITELEKRSLGTKATRADVVEALFKRHYVKGDSNIEGTELGMQTLDTLEKYAPRIVDQELTRHFEEEMEEIREGKKQGEKVLTEAKKSLKPILEDFKKSEKKVGEELIGAHRTAQDIQNTLGQCPKCTKGTMKVTFSKKNRKRFLGCDAYPDCENTYPLPQKGMVTPTEKQCEHCNAPIIKMKAGRRSGELCINNECPAKETTDEAEERTCPKCNKALVLRKSIYGTFYGCSSYPKCRHTEKIKEKE